MDCSFTAQRWWNREGGAVALVTGGNQGIGMEACRLLVQQGVQTVLASRDAERGAAAASALEAELGSVVYHVQLDLTDQDSVLRAEAEVRARFGGLDILLNNAGLAFKGSTFDAKSARDTLDTNLRGTRSVTEAFLPLLRARAPGSRVVNVCSMAGKRRIVGAALRARFDAARSYADVEALADEFVAAVESGADLASLGWPRSMYGVSKLCEATYTRLLAAELEQEGVGVAACCPGWCSTSMSSFSGPRTAAQGADTVVWLALEPALPTGRFWSERREEEF